MKFFLTIIYKYVILEYIEYKEEIVILGENILIDIENMPRKIMDISLVEENKSDYTFFKIDEDENEDNNTLKALKQTYVTSNYKNETILNLQKELNTNSTEISKEIKLESYNKYNNALDLAIRHYITRALELVEEALLLNPKDPDILNLKGLLSLLKCDFAKSFESFYTSQCYGNNELSRKYVTYLSSKDFKLFLERYNHSIRFINEELNEESIEIFDSLIKEHPELIEPYVISILLYEKVGDEEKKKVLLDDLSCIDKDNPIFEKLNEAEKNTVNQKVEATKEESKEISKKKETKSGNKRNLVLYAIIGLLIVVIGAFYINSQRKIEDLNKEITSKEDVINEKDKELSQKAEEEEKQKAEKENAKKEAEIIKKGVENLYITASKYQQAGNYKEAINYYNYALKAEGSSKYKSQAVYNIALCYKSMGDNEKAIEYFEKFISNYSAAPDYFDDAFYFLGMLYYEEGRLQDAKNIFYTLRAKYPTSDYNKTQQVKDILKK